MSDRGGVECREVSWIREDIVHGQTKEIEAWDLHSKNSRLEGVDLRIVEFERTESPP